MKLAWKNIDWHKKERHVDDVNESDFFFTLPLISQFFAKASDRREKRILFPSL